MATRNQILEALRGVRSQFPSNSSYVGIARNVVSISNCHSVMFSDIRFLVAIPISLTCK
jgi:hypothetical protein